jgi:superfamily II DNA/RNA helicase
LFSATQTTKVEDLARVSLKRAPLYISVHEKMETATVEGLEQVCFFFLLPSGIQCQAKSADFGYPFPDS